MASEFDNIVQELEENGWKIQQFERLGMGFYDAVDAVNKNIDYHDVEYFVKQHPDCSPQMAVKIL